MITVQQTRQSFYFVMFQVMLFSNTCIIVIVFEARSSTKCIGTEKSLKPPFWDKLEVCLLLVVNNKNIHFMLLTISYLESAYPITQDRRHWSGWSLGSVLYHLYTRFNQTAPNLVLPALFPCYNRRSYVSGIINIPET